MTSVINTYDPGLGSTPKETPAIDWTKHDALARDFHDKQSAYDALGIQQASPENTIARERSYTEVEIARRALKREQDWIMGEQLRGRQ